MTKLDLTTKYFLQIITIIFIMYSLIVIGIVGIAYGQNVTPPKPVQPTVTIPAQTQPNPNLQYLPQKAYVQAFGPEYGLPASPTPLQSIAPVPVQQVAPAQSTSTGIPGLDLAAIAALAATGINYFKTHIVGKKTDKVEEVTREQSEQIIKGAQVDKSIADTMFKLAPEEKVKAMEGTAPEIRLAKLEENTEEAIKTASKS